MDLETTPWTASLLALGLVILVAIPAQAGSTADTCAWMGPDASDDALTADPIEEDGTCFGSLFRQPADDMRDWYRRDVLPGALATTMDASVCADGDGETVTLQVYFVENADPDPIPGPDDRFGVLSASPGSCSDRLQVAMGGLTTAAGGTWYFSLTSAPDAGYALMTAVD